MQFKDFAKSITGFDPYEYQLKVNEILESGKNVILSVPTGAGKTWASVLPFLYAKETESHFPKKMIYSLPLRALTNSIYSDVFAVLRKKGLTEDEITRQTGEYSDDKYFEKDIIFSTIDQTLSNFLCFPLPLSHRQANINAGSLIGSYLVFDEFHLLDETKSMATSLGMLKILGNLCRCCIMTATMSDDLMHVLKSELKNYEILTLDDFQNDVPKIKSLIPSKDKKHIKVEKTRLNALKIVEEHENIIEKDEKRTIVICNRVENAQRIYNEIKAELERRNLSTKNLICLHSRFFDNHRKEKEDRLKSLFGKGSKENAILISTQVIEAGMDISSKILHAEISPINSFLQRVGRCARFENEIGKIFIYDVLDVEEKDKITIEPTTKEDKAEIKALKNRYLPYDEPLCQETLNHLEKYKTLDEDIPKRLIKDVMGEKEREIAEILRGCNFKMDDIKESWKTCKKNFYRETVRDIQSVEVILISDTMKDQVERNPFRFQSVGIFKWSLVSWLKKIEESEDYDREQHWLIKKVDESQFDDIDMGNETKYWLNPIGDYKEMPNQVFLNAEFFGYSDEIGFNNFDSKTFKKLSPFKPFKEKEEKGHVLKKDTFYQHNKALIGCFEEEFLPKLKFVFNEFAYKLERIDLKNYDFEKLIKLMIILHDYGKLNETWQRPMRTYQAKQEGKELKEFTDILAHTDFDSESEADKKLGEESKLNKRPPHAGVGAWIAKDLIENLFDDENIAASVSMAIARHHSSLNKTNKLVAFKIPNKYYAAMKELLAEYDFDFDLQQEEDEQTLYDLEESQILLYLFLVRILRLCDQKATENFRKYLKN